MWLGLGRGWRFCVRTLEVSLLHATNVNFSPNVPEAGYVMLCYCIQKCGDKPCFPVGETCDWPREADGVGV